jgi:putative heme transporter
MPVADETAALDGGERRSRASRYWRIARPIVLLAVAFLVARIIIGLVGAIDWSSVWSAVRQLTLPGALLMLLVLLARQSFNAVPLARFVKGLSLPRSMQNDLGAILVGTVAPPPSDVVLRVSMFRSWGIDPLEGMAGVTLNTLTFYVVRFSAPALGLLLFAFIEAEAGHVWAAVGSAVVALVILVALVSLSRGDRLARIIGLTAGRVASRIRHGIEPEAWSTAVVEFRGRVGDRVRTGITPSLLALLFMVLAESLLLITALRLVGVGSDAVATVLVLSTFLLAYPLTLFPLMGLGILDAVLVAAWTQVAGVEYEARIVAGLIVWRVFSLLVPILLGVVAVSWWRRTTHAAGDPA